MAQLQKLILKDIKAAKPKDKPYTLADGGGLVLIVNTNGTYWWRYRYRFHGTAKMLSLGTYPDVSLDRARKKHQKARALLDDDIDPSAKRQAEREAVSDSFEAVAGEFLKQADVDESTRTAMRRRFELYIYPRIGKRPVSDIDSQELLKALRKVESRGTFDTVQRIRSACSRVFRFAIATGRASIDPAEPLKGALKPAKAKHRATITNPKGIGELLRAIDGYHGHPVTAAALKLAPLVFVRPGELRTAEWHEIDLDTAVWRIPASKMKMGGNDHVVPLSTQAVDLLRDLLPLTGPDGFVFPGLRSDQRPMSDNTLNAALRRLGYSKEEIVAHGFRGMASTALNELGHHPDHIERQLAHQPRNKVRAAYNHAQHLTERVQMMQEWSDYLDGLKSGAELVPLHGADNA